MITAHYRTNSLGNEASILDYRAVDIRGERKLKDVTPWGKGVEYSLRDLYEDNVFSLLSRFIVDNEGVDPREKCVAFRSAKSANGITKIEVNGFKYLRRRSHITKLKVGQDAD